MIREFALERYFARWEFAARHLLSASDCEPMTVRELLDVCGAPASMVTELRLSYAESQGAPTLRERIARMYRGLDAEDIVVAVPEEAIYLAMSTLLAPGDRVVVQVPCYQSLGEIAAHRGCEVQRWALQETETGWRMDLDRLSELLTPATRLLVVNAPHNPTGFVPSAAEYDALLGLVQERGVWLFFDEMYAGLERAPAVRLPPAVTRYERAICLSGMSKSYALPGLRLGWLALRDRRLRDAIVRYKDYTTICATSMSERLAELALDHAAPILERNRAIIAGNLQLARDFTTRHSGLLAWRHGDGGSVVFPRFVRGGAAAFCDAAAAKGIMIVPSTMFEFGDEHIRLGLGRRGFGEALEALEGILR